MKRMQFNQNVPSKFAVACGMFVHGMTFVLRRQHTCVEKNKEKLAERETQQTQLQRVPFEYKQLWPEPIQTLIECYKYIQP